MVALNKSHSLSGEKHVMRPFIAAILCLTAAVGAGGISANAAVIASCGDMEGYSYFYRDGLAGYTPDWKQGSLKATIIFLGTDKVEEVVLSSKLGEEDWTRSASDYGAPVIEVARQGSIRHILILWGPVTELYALDTEKKIIALVSHKSGIVKVTNAFVGKCE